MNLDPPPPLVGCGKRLALFFYIFRGGLKTDAPPNPPTTHRGVKKIGIPDDVNKMILAITLGRLTYPTVGKSSTQNCRLIGEGVSFQEGNE